MQNKDWLEPLSDKEFESLEDNAFIKLLGEEVGIEFCKIKGCTHKQIKNSVLCRKHHFENIKKRPFPERAI